MPEESRLQVAKRYNSAMPKLSIQPNTKVYVRINPTATKSTPLHGEFLGLSHFDYLILRLPSIPGLLNKLIPQTMVEIRFLHEGAVNTFSTEVIAYSVKPALCLFTTYPDRLSIMETRNFPRVPCALPAELTTRSVKAQCIITDLSRGGCRIIAELSGQSGLREVRVPEEAVLQTVFSAGGHSPKGAATIRNFEISGTRFHAGLSFNEGYKEFTSALNGYIELAGVLF